MFFIPVIVDHNGSTSEIDVISNIRIADIRQMGCLGIVADHRILQLDKITDSGSVADSAPGADIGKRSDRAVRTDRALRNLRCIDLCPVIDLCLFEYRIRPDRTEPSDSASGIYHRSRENTASFTDHSIRRNPCAVRVHDADSILHQPVRSPLLYAALNFIRARHRNHCRLGQIDRRIARLSL